MDRKSGLRTPFFSFCDGDMRVVSPWNSPLYRIKSLAFPIALFIATATAAWFSGDILRVGEHLGTARRVISLGLQTAVWLTAAFAIIRIVQVFIWERLAADYLGAPVPRLIRDMVAGIIMMIACSGVAGIVFERDITGILATSGLLGIVIGFSLQTIILDVFTGLAIHFDRPFSIGDWIKMHGEMRGTNGQVLEINY